MNSPTYEIRQEHDQVGDNDCASAIYAVHDDGYEDKIAIASTEYLAQRIADMLNG